MIVLEPLNKNRDALVHRVWSSKFYQRASNWIHVSVNTESMSLKLSYMTKFGISVLKIHVGYCFDFDTDVSK